MKKPAIAILMLSSLACLPARSDEMFETYTKRFALGYVDDLANARYWLSPTWGLEMTATIDDSSASSKLDDGVIIAEDQTDFTSYTFGFAAVRAIKSYRYFDLNLKGGFLYSSGDGEDDPEGPANATKLHESSHSLFFGPEVEIKIPHFSRLVIVSSLQLTYTVDKATTRSQNPFGDTSVENERKSFGLRSNENSLDEFMHLGIRYYF